MLLVNFIAIFYHVIMTKAAIQYIKYVSSHVIYRICLKVHYRNNLLNVS